MMTDMIMRRSSGLIERLCEHGIGHPDLEASGLDKDSIYGIHGCDGCCNDHDQ